MPAKLLSAVLALAIVTLHLSASAATAPNLLPNPGFERPLPGHDWMPAAWDTSDAGATTAFFGRDTLLKHSGHYSVSLANTSTVFSLGHNWNMPVLVGRTAWDRTATFSVWTFSAGQEGRAFILLQAYSDTVSKLARLWGVPRDEARRRFGVAPINDPLQNYGWKRLQFEGGEEGWVRREVQVYVPSGTNVLFVRCGLFGTGQVAFDDASLTLGPAGPPPSAPVGQNLLLDPGFEQGALQWEWATTPFEGARIDCDTTVAHTGRRSMRCSEMSRAIVSMRAGMCAGLPGRLLAGKRVRLSAWFRGDSIGADCYTQVAWDGAAGTGTSGASPPLHGTFDWSRTYVDVDVPAEAKMVWAWLQFSAPAAGRVWIDDASLEVLGVAEPAGDRSRTPASRRH
jgi:hypothetical protein